jgi:hypothetical protein
MKFNGVKKWDFKNFENSFQKEGGQRNESMIGAKDLEY